MTIRVLPHDPHDRELLQNVHPADWVPPEPAPLYNLVVVGAGTAGLVTAAGAAGLGARVALVERELMGGDCLNVGCVPSKALIRCARAFADVRDAGSFGVRVPAGASVDFPAVMDRMRRLRASLSPTDSAARFRSLGVDVFLGEGRFTGPDTLEVAGSTLRFRKAVIATGARAVRPRIDGLAEVGFLTNESIFALTALPQRLVVIGAGPIGCELAQTFARFGSKVTLVSNRPGILPKEDPDAVELVKKSLLEDGVSILAEAKVLSAAPRGLDKVLRIEIGGSAMDVAADEILAGTGRAPNVEGLGLDAARVKHDERNGVAVDDHLRTTNPRIYAAGDICSRFQFTHAADAMARIVIQNALFLGRARASALTIPRCTYTDPEVAQVGLNEAEAAARGIRTRTYLQSLEHVDRAVLDGEAEGFVKVHVRDGTDRIVGATVVARHAGELLPELALAMTEGVGLRAIARTIHAYPTQAEAIKKAADAHNRTRLTPLVKRLFEKWLAWMR